MTKLNIQYEDIEEVIRNKTAKIQNNTTCYVLIPRKYEGMGVDVIIKKLKTD